jgi:excisionase family DNA binding protein
MPKSIDKNLKLLPTKEYFSTGEVAELCSVTPDTVLKWIRAGKIPAIRTPGGHHRISRTALQTLIQDDEVMSESAPKRSAFQYCWEFYTKTGAQTEACRKCIVYRSKSSRCYEMNDLPTEAGYVGLFCDSNCEKCEYFAAVHGQPSNVLVVTDKNRLRDALEKDAREIDFNLKIADSEYRCSMVVERFRPDYVVIDCSMGADRCARITQLLDEDPRIPFVRIILSGSPEDLPKGCDKMIFALIDRHFTARMLFDLVDSSKSQLSGAS